jgi:general secretion pathway protein E
VLSGIDAFVNRRRLQAGRNFPGFESKGIRERVAEVARRLDECLASPHADVIGAFDQLVRGAVAVEASDLHMSPTPRGFRLTYRVHGTLYEVALLPLDVAPRLSTRVKVLARLDTYIRGTPQDGRLVIAVEGHMIEARVSTLPTENGERIVLRFVRGSRSVPELDSLGFSQTVLAGIKELLSRPQGLLFMTAPVGSGKTTTLYAALKHIAETRGRTTTLVTLEDPIELELPFATQTQMHPKSGMTFAATLRSVLRQDPNVLMVGEIRDHETADIAMQAGLTGHLILTTVHGDTAAGPFARIIDMRVEPFVLASATIGCVSQRLVRTLCTGCRREAQPEPMIIERFRQHGVGLPPGRYYEPVGCDYCEGQGFTGRRPIAELLVVDAAIRAAINDRRPTRDIHQLAVSHGMTPLLYDGLESALAGETSLSEVLRVAG